MKQGLRKAAAGFLALKFSRSICKTCKQKVAEAITVEGHAKAIEDMPNLLCPECYKKIERLTKRHQKVLRHLNKTDDE